MRNCTMHSFFRWKERLPCRVRVKLGVLLSSCLCIVTVVVGSSSGHTGQMTMSELAKHTRHNVKCAPGAHLCDCLLHAHPRVVHTRIPNTRVCTLRTTCTLHATQITGGKVHVHVCTLESKIGWRESDALYVQNKCKVFCTYTGHVQKNRLLVEVCTCYLYMYIK